MLAALAFALLLSPDAFRVKVQPNVGMAPCTVRVTVHAPQEEALYDVQVVSEGGFYQHTTKTQPPRTWQFPDFKDLPSDQYEVVTQVVDYRGAVVHSDRQPMLCKGFEPER